MNSNHGFGLKKKGVGKKESEQDTGSILKSAANDQCVTQNSKPQQRAKVKATKGGGKVHLQCTFVYLSRTMLHLSKKKTMLLLLLKTD